MDEGTGRLLTELLARLFKNRPNLGFIVFISIVIIVMLAMLFNAKNPDDYIFPILGLVFVFIVGGIHALRILRYQSVQEIQPIEETPLEQEIFPLPVEITQPQFVADRDMSVIKDTGEAPKKLKNRRAWWLPVRNCFIATVLASVPSFCISYFLLAVLPTPACVDPNGVSFHQDLLALAVIEVLGMVLTLPVVAILSILAGFAVYFIFKSRWKEKNIGRISTAIGLAIPLLFWGVLDILLNRFICEL